MNPIRARILVGICCLAMLTLSGCGLQPDPNWPPSPKPVYRGNGLKSVTHPWSNYY